VLTIFLFALLAVCGVSTNAAQATPSSAEAGSTCDETVSIQKGGHPVNIRITIGSTNLAATLEDNPTARDFAALLPLTVTLEDFNSAEKISGALPKRLSQEDAPATAVGAVGDIAFYAPWGNLALFYRPGPRARGLIKMGRITSGMAILSQPGPLRATISHME
jgi:hypothetical protein